MNKWIGFVTTFLDFFIKKSANELSLKLHRHTSGDTYTVSSLFEMTTDGEKFLCYALEDGFKYEKVAGLTRIPAGTYNITLRTVGGFHARYSKKFPEFHKGMLWIRDVPNYEYILIHIGNYPKDTDGCILVGETYSFGYIGNSTETYKKIYPPIAEHLLSGKRVTIDIVDGDR